MYDIAPKSTRFARPSCRNSHEVLQLGELHPSPAVAIVERVASLIESILSRQCYIEDAKYGTSVSS